MNATRRPVRIMALLSSLTIAASVLAAGPAQALTIQEYALPTQGSNPVGIALGSDGNLWFTESSSNKIGRITPTGTITEFAIPTAASAPLGIAAGSDGNLWFTEDNANKIGRITTSGAFTEFGIPTASSAPTGIAAGPDGKLWFTENLKNKIGRISTSGVFSNFAIPTAKSGPIGITAGPDGRMWFTESAADQIGQISTSGGTVTEFPVTSFARPTGIAPGSDGNVWFTEPGLGQIGQITTSGVVSEFAVKTATGAPEGIAPGPDGNLWFTEERGNNLGVITTTGVVSEFAIPTSNSFPDGIASGPHGTVWFTEYGGQKIGTAPANAINVSYIAYIPNRFFIPNITPLPQRGDAASWLMLNPGLHGVVDPSGMGLFGSQDAMLLGSVYTFTFKWAGHFAFDDPLHRASKGMVKAPISVQLLPGTTNQAVVTWASGDAPGGFAFDIQVAQPGSSAFADWRVGQTALNGQFGPADPRYVGPGTYQFRARLRNVANNTFSGYSDPMAIALT